MTSSDSFGSRMFSYLQSRSDSFAPFVKQGTANNVLESSSKYFVQDLIGEGPIAGLVGPDGNELILFDNGQNNIEILKGIYLNDYPIVNDLTNSYNYNRVNIYSRSGTEFQSFLPAGGVGGFSFANPGVAYSFDKTIYGIANSVSPNHIKGSNHSSSILIFKNFQLDKSFNLRDADLTSLKGAFNPKNFQESFGVYHEIKEQITDYLFLSLKLNGLYTTSDDGSTLPNTATFGIEIGYKLKPSDSVFIFHKVYGISTSPYAFDLFFDVSDFDFSLQPFIRVYNFSPKQNPTDFKNARSLAVTNITEVTSLKFKYPNSCYFLSVFDGRGFPNPPNRSFDLKLLKIKVPENYDAEGKSYDGFWNGEFDAVLRWTDNPAWILYDIITNNRYGVGKFGLQQNLVDKWNLYKIAKYCDEMVPTNAVSRFPVQQIYGLSENKISIYTPGQKLTSFFKIFDYIDLVNLKFQEIDENGEQVDVYRSYRAIIYDLDFCCNDEGVIITLINPFGLHKILSLFPNIRNYIYEKYNNPKEINIYKRVFADILDLVGTSDPAYADFNNYLLGQQIFSNDDIINYIQDSGVAASEYQGFSPLVEPRFRCNLSIANETDVINLVNNISSVFKGMVYWSNNLINFDSDRPKLPIYFFNNSNVKDGIFNYTGSSKDTRYTVAKVVYSDETDSFKDKTVYVEDKFNIRRYGYIEKEIIGLGITSKSQAKRIGEWFLITNQVEEELVSFTAGPEALLLAPGNVISITDQLKLSGRRGGRVVSVTDAGIVTLDDKYDFIKAGDILSFIIPKAAKTVNDLALESQKTNEVTDKSINQLQPTFIYRFEVFDVSLEGNFRTQVTLKLDSFETQQNLYSIFPSAMWVYEKDSADTSVAFSKQYRIISIKEKSQVEFDFTAAEYQKTKFAYFENNKNIIVNNLYSDSSSNTNSIIPIDILGYQKGNGSRELSDYINIDIKVFNINEQFDYIIPSYEYSDDIYSNLISVIEVKNSNLFQKAKTHNPNCKGFVVEYVLNSKKVSYVWRLGDKNSVFIAVPKVESSVSFENLRVYMIGDNDVFINPVT